MKLLMYLDNDLIESVQLENDKIRIPGYVGDYKRSLKIKYHEMIKQHSTPPDFLVTNILPPDHHSDRIK